MEEAEPRVITAHQQNREAADEKETRDAIPASPNTNRNENDNGEHHVSSSAVANGVDSNVFHKYFDSVMDGSGDDDNVGNESIQVDDGVKEETLSLSEEIVQEEKKRDMSQHESPVASSEDKKEESVGNDAVANKNYFDASCSSISINHEKKVERDGNNSKAEREDAIEPKIPFWSEVKSNNTKNNVGESLIGLPADDSSSASTDLSDEYGEITKSAASSSVDQFCRALEAIYKTSNLRDRAKECISELENPFSYCSNIDIVEGRITVDNDDDAEILEAPFQIRIKGEMLGLTVENVLESTFIRTIVPTGMAALAGAKVGCVISQIGEHKTEHLTHFETIEMLRSSHRPLVLTLEPRRKGHLPLMRDYMAELVDGWKHSPAVGLLGSKVDLGVKFISAMSVLLAKIEVEDGTGESLQDAQQIILDFVSRQLTGSATTPASTKQSSAKNDQLGTSKAVKLNKMPTKKLLKKHFKQTLNRITNNPTPKQQNKKHNFTQILTKLNPFWKFFGDLGRDIILILLDSGEENYKVLFQLMAHDLNIPLSDELLQGEDNAILTEDKMPDIMSHVDDVRDVSVTTYLPLVHATSQAALSKRKCCAVVCRLLWSSKGHLVDHPNVRLQIRGVLTRLLHDVDGGVRQTTVQTLLFIISTLDHTHLNSIGDVTHERLDPTLGWLITLAQRLLTDPVADLRSKSVLLATEVAAMLPKGASNIESYLLQCKILPITSRTAEDKNAIVRQALALHLPRLIAALSPHWVGVLLDVIIALLEDDDHIVKIGVLVTLVDLEPTLLDTILPLILKLVSDEAAGVRCALARTAGQLLIHCHRGDNKDLQRHMDATLLPLIQRLLHDDDAQVTSAALRAVSDATSYSEIKADGGPSAKAILTEKHVLRLLPTLRHLTTNPIWRVRSSAVEIVPTLLECTYKLDVRVEIAQLCISLLNDKVDCVRTMAAEALCGGKCAQSPIVESSQHELADFEWIDLVVLPHLKACSQSQDYRQRLLSFKIIRALFRHSDNLLSNQINTLPKLRQAIIGILQTLTTDPVANVRLNIGRILCNCGQHFDAAEHATLICILEDLLASETAKTDGGDRDVRLFTHKAQMHIQNLYSQNGEKEEPDQEIRKDSNQIERT